MKYTDNIERAIRFAATQHDGHVRVERERLPYITHCFSVSILVSNFTENEDTIIAALLHDSLEDTKATPEDIEELFGKNVREIVEILTEPKNLLWRERKNTYLEQLERAPYEALIIAAADKIHNIQSKLALVLAEGSSGNAKWSNPPSEYLWYHGCVVEIISRKLKNPISLLLQETYKKEQDSATLQ